MQSTVLDLANAPVHEPEDERLTAAEFALYRAGYAHALHVVQKAIDATMQRFELVERTKRLDARRKRSE